jgi:hypothetical protein
MSIARSTEWQAAIQHEFDSLMDNATWELVDRLEGRAAVNIMWI